MPARAAVAVIALSLALLASARPSVAAAQESTVHAVLFFSPTCPHCQRVLQNVLPGIFSYFGGAPQFHPGTAGHLLTNGKLEILLVDVTQIEGQVLYRTSGEALRLAPERQGVPRLVCGDRVLVGEFEIPDQFPAIIRYGLAHGGVPWPDIAGLAAAFPPGFPMRPSAAGRTNRPAGGTGPAAPPAESAAAAPGTMPRRTPEAAAARGEGAAPGLVLRPNGSALSRTFASDPIGGTLALGILAAMLFSLGMMLTPVPGAVPPTWSRLAPLLAIAGIGVAAYLAYVEASGAAAVCGPIGDCNAVQQSPYARLWGIPVAVLGLVGYATILAAWIGSRYAPRAARGWAAIVAFALSLVGTAASALLTVLEPFVIGAVCSWCLTSAVLMTLLLWLLARPAAEARSALRA